MIEEMRVESSNFDAVDWARPGPANLDDDAVGRQHPPRHRQLSVLVEQVQRAEPQSEADVHAERAGTLYESGRSHNTAFTLGGPVVIPKIVDGRNKLFFFANYSYVNDFIPGKNQGIQLGAGERGAAARGLLGSAQAAEPGAIPDLRSVDRATRPEQSEPVHSRSVPGNIIPANRIVNPLYRLYQQMVPPPNQNLIENGTNAEPTTTTAVESPTSRSARCMPAGSTTTSASAIGFSSAPPATRFSRA